MRQKSPTQLQVNRCDKAMWGGAPSAAAMPDLVCSLLRRPITQHLGESRPGHMATWPPLRPGRAACYEWEPCQSHMEKGKQFPKERVGWYLAVIRVGAGGWMNR